MAPGAIGVQFSGVEVSLRSDGILYFGNGTCIMLPTGSTSTGGYWRPTMGGLGKPTANTPGTGGRTKKLSKLAIFFAAGSVVVDFLI